MAKAKTSSKVAAAKGKAVKATEPKVAAKVAAKATNGSNGNGKSEAKAQLPMPVLCKACAKQMGSDWEIKPVVNPERSDAAKRAWVTIRANREAADAKAAADAAALAKAVKRGKPSNKLIKSKKA